MTLRSPVDPDRYAGTVTSVTATHITANLPFAVAKPEIGGNSKGGVGEFVFVDCGSSKVLGRITEVKIPDGERLSVEPQLGHSPISHPIGKVHLLATVEQGTNRLQRGMEKYPSVGDAVYLAEPTLLAELIDSAISKKSDLTLSLGRMAAADGVQIRLPPEKLFGRHCGIFGATGGGKSWTIAALIEQIRNSHGKAIVFDPTGEFGALKGISRRFSFGDEDSTYQTVHFPYRHMTEEDLFSLFRPSGQSQGPKLREAIRSLKLVRAMNGTYPTGVSCTGQLLLKNQKKRMPFFSAIKDHAKMVHSPFCDFNIDDLPDQIKQECIRATGNDGCFGGPDESTVGYCETLISRIGTLIRSKELECVFQTKGSSLVDGLDTFLSNDSESIAIISFKDVRFEHNTREILLNIIGRYMLGLARDGRFRERPIVMFLDEAHQFLGRVVGDEYANVRLDAFGLIAKEGRKYGLTCVLATQRPRDIPQDVISQLGTLIVHRLTNEQDRETVEKACGDLDRGAAQFIPMLAPGEAILIGPDLPVSVPLNMNTPSSPPDSKGPVFQSYWAARKKQADQCENVLHDADLEEILPDAANDLSLRGTDLSEDEESIIG